MKLMEFINKIKGDFDRKDLIEKVTGIGQEYDEMVLPSLSLCADELDPKLYKDLPSPKEIFRNINRGHLGHKIEDIADLHKVMLTVRANLKFLENEVKSFKGIAIVKSGITYQQATLLNLIGLFDFLADEIIGILYLIVDDVATKVYKADSSVSKHSRNHYEDVGFFLGSLINVLEVTPAEFKKNFMSIPKDPVIADNIDIYVSTHPTVDSLGLNRKGIFGGIPAWVNPAYWVGVLVAEVQVYLYERKLKKRDIIILKIQALKQAQANNADPAFQREIEIYEQRLERLEADIEAKEEQYAG